MLSLEGIRVLDLSRVLAAPFCTMILGDLGADIIKVERPGRGDDTRAWDPPSIGGESAYFLCVNRNKRSITVDLKSEGGKEIIRRLAKHCDVLMENFRPGVLDSLGLGYEVMREVNPRLVFCSLTGYGQTGPYSHRPGYDLLAQAEGGLMSVTGPEDGEPYKVGASLADIMTGLFAAIGMLSALRERESSGEGQHIDVCLLDTVMAALSNVASNALISGKTPGRYGNEHPNIVPYQSVPTADGYMMVAVGNDQQWMRFCRAVDKEEWITDPRFATNPNRVNNRDALRPLLNEVTATRSSEEWLSLLREANIPCGPVNTVAQALSLAHSKAREMVVTMSHPTVGEVPLVGSPLKLSRTPVAMRRHPPLLGEHTDEILQDLGSGPGDIARLHAEGCV
ncbi:MAG: CoA transferase [Chloroflexota bacterium]